MATPLEVRIGNIALRMRNAASDPVAMQRIIDHLKGAPGMGAVCDELQDAVDAMSTPRERILAVCERLIARAAG